MTFKADNSEQLSKWIAQLQSSLLEVKAEGDQVSVQGTEGREHTANSIGDSLVQDSYETLGCLCIPHSQSRLAWCLAL